MVWCWFFFFVSIAFDKNHKPLSCRIPESLLLCSQHPQQGSSFVGNKAQFGGGRREQQPSPAAHPAANPGRARLCSGWSLCIQPGEENAIPGPGGLLRAGFTFQASSQGTGLGAHPKPRAKSATVRSSAAGKHWECRLEPGSFPGVI